MGSKSSRPTLCHLGCANLIQSCFESENHLNTISPIIKSEARDGNYVIPELTLFHYKSKPAVVRFATVSNTSWKQRITQCFTHIITNVTCSQILDSTVGKTELMTEVPISRILHRFHSCYYTELPSWIVRMRLVRCAWLSKSEIQLQGAIQLKLLSGNLESPKFATARGITEPLTEFLSLVLRHLFQQAAVC